MPSAKTVKQPLDVVSFMRDPSLAKAVFALALVLGGGVFATAVEQPKPILGAPSNTSGLVRTVKTVRESKSHVVLPDNEKTYVDEISSNSTLTVETLLE